MAGQPQAHDPEAAVVEALTQSPQAVGRVGHAVQQQHAAGCPVGRELEAAVPIGRPASRVHGAAGAVAGEGAGGPGLCQGVDPRVQLLKQRVFQSSVVIERSDLVRPGRCELCRQLFGVPRLQGGAAARPGHVERNDTHDEAEDGDGKVQAEAPGELDDASHVMLPGAGTRRPATKDIAAGRSSGPPAEPGQF